MKKTEEKSAKKKTRKDKKKPAKKWEKGKKNPGKMEKKITSVKSNSSAELNSQAIRPLTSMTSLVEQYPSLLKTRFIHFKSCI